MLRGLREKSGLFDASVQEEDSNEDDSDADSQGDLLGHLAGGQGQGGARGVATGDVQSLIQLEMLQTLRDLRGKGKRSRKTGEDSSSSSGSEPTVSRSKSRLRRVLQMRKKVKKHPMKYVNGYVKHVKSRLAAWHTGHLMVPLEDPLAAEEFGGSPEELMIAQQYRTALSELRRTGKGKKGDEAAES